VSIPSPRPEQPAPTAEEVTMRLLADPDRMRELARIDLDDPVLRARLDAIAHDTRVRLGATISLITLVLDSVQLIAGSDGLDGWMAEAGGTPVEWSFCANAVLTGRPYVVEDAARDPRQLDNPLVTQDGIASYCGVPLTGASGQVLGAHCVLGRRPEEYTAEHLAALHEAGLEVSRVLAEYTHAPSPAE
jgi:GAF domain-containing protein